MRSTRRSPNDLLRSQNGSRSTDTVAVSPDNESCQELSDVVRARLRRCEYCHGDNPGRPGFTYNPQSVGGMQVFTKEQREFAVGNRVHFTQPWRSKQVDNRDFGTITYLDENGNAHVTLDKKGHRQVSFNMPHLDHGYVVTSYSIQLQRKTC